VRAERLRVLVTGGAGFIGAHLVEGLLADGHRVRVLDNFASGHIENLSAVRADVEIQEGDCEHPADAQKAARGMDVVYHEAAVPNVARSLEDPELCRHAGSLSTLNMLEASCAAGVRKFVYAGSSAVYSESAQRPKRESMAPHPISPYAVEKRVGEHFLPMFTSLYGMETVALRYFNVFGPRQDAGCPYSGVILRFIAALLRGEMPVMAGDGGQSRDFTYVADVVGANLLALRATGLVGQAINIATGRGTTFNRLLALLCEETGQTCRPVHGPAGIGGVRHSVADVALAHRVLGYRPLVDLETGLRRTVSWYRNLAAPPVVGTTRARDAVVAP
jgi:UDP-glucose 4-epimerase